MGVCSSCGTANPERARFCMACGAALAGRCESCGTENPPGAKFCIECGSRLGAAPAASGPGTAGGAGTGGDRSELPEERRKATVLFADLSGYTAVAERLDPEALKSMVDRALRRLGDEVVRFGGSVDKFIGDNVMAVFGAPTAHEDDPERAVRAGLAMQSAMTEINSRIATSSEVEFALRVGVNSGEVLAGQVGDGYTVMGDAVNVASRLQAAARPGTVTVGESTYRLSRHAIEYEELEPLQLRGKSEPVPAWEAVRVSVGGAAMTRAATPLIGRDDEITLLRSLFDRVVREGRPHLVTVMGQAGVGKSRLLRELTTQLRDPGGDGPLVRVGRCPAYGSGIAYWALGEIIRDQFQIVDTDDAELAWRKLRDGFVRLFEAGSAPDVDESPQRIAATVARTLGVEPPAEATADTGPEGEDPQQTRARLFSAVRSLVESASRIHPVVFAIEDIHWADEGMLDLIEYLTRWVRAPVLLVCLARDELLERRPTWGGGRRNATLVALEPLDGSGARELVAALLPEGEDGDQLVADVAQRSGGNPLFAEEMVNRLLEGGGESEELPETVHAVLAARLDALPDPERRLLQHASVVGQIFWEGSVAEVASAHGVDVAAALDSLADKDLIIPTAGSRLAGEREFALKHVLIRDVAYSTLPKTVRARKHAEVADFIERRAADRSEGVIAMVADHLFRAAGIGAEAGLEPDALEAIDDRARAALEAAGDAAAALFSNQEACSQYERALALDGEQRHAETRARVSEKLGDVALRLGRIDRAVQLWEECLEYHRGQEELARVGDLHRKIGAGLWNKGDREGSIGHYQRGIDLLKDGPPSLELVRLYEEAASLYMHTGDNMLAIYASEKALRLAERLGESAAASRAHGIFGRVFGRIGDLERARENLERSVELARDADPAEAIRALLALGYHFETSEAGYEAAAEAYGEALGIAERIGDIPSQVELHAALALLALHRGEWAKVQAGTETVAGLVEREGLTGKLCFPHLLRGALRWRADDQAGSERSLRRAAEMAEQVGRSEICFQALYWLAFVLRERGAHADADQALATALDTCERAGLVAQSVEATAARAVNHALWGRAEQAAALAAEAAGLSERLRYPVGAASALEARGVAERNAALLEQAREAWLGLCRPLDAERAQRLSERLAAAS